MRSWISLATSLLLLAVTARAGGPVDFGKSELQAALAGRKLKTKVQAELSLDPPESFRIETYKAGGAHVTGSDLRGLMYGLIEAAEQIRSTGKLKAVRGVPAMTVRGVRIAPQIADLRDPKFFADARWQAYFQMLARSRINRFNLVVPLPEARPAYVRFLSQTASDYGVDFTLGVRPPLGVPGELYAGLRKLLDACPMIRGVEIEAENQPVDFYRDNVFAALRESGRRVTLDLHGAEQRSDLTKGALEAGVPLRVSRKSGSDDPGYEVHWELHEASVTASVETVRQKA
ncbi:MAG: hypothetical protein ACRD5L_07710 [Bryobacteraceae bacterium]